LRVLREEAERETKARREEAMAAQVVHGSGSARREGGATPMTRAIDGNASGAERRGSSVRKREAYGTRRGTKTLLSGAIVLTALAAMLVYSFAPQIVKLIPETEPHLIVYVEYANELRTLIKELIKAMVDTALRVPESNS